MATFKTYSVVVKTQGGDSFTFTGAEGAKAYEQISHKESVHASTGTGNKTIIPFWSIDSAVVTVGSETKEMKDNACIEG